VVAGRLSRTPGGRLAARAVSMVRPDSFTDAESILAGYETAGDLLADLHGDPDDPVFRIEFRHPDGPDPRSELAESDSLDEVDVDAIMRDWRN
jgi:hypothetical protein